MGFFSDLKEDLAQAVNELTEDTTEKELLEEEELLKKELAEMEDELQVTGVDEAFAGVNEEVMATLSAGYASATEELPDEEGDLAEEFEAALAGFDITDDMVDELVESETADSILTVNEEYEDGAVAELISDEMTEETADMDELQEVEEIEEIEEIEEMIDMVQDDLTVMSGIKEDTFVSMADENAEVGVIPAGMMITGDIATAGALDLRGTVLGNIEIGGKLNVSGSIQGNSKAVEIFAQAAKITGDIECDNSVKIGPNSVVIGNISARSAVIAGAVKGDIDVRGPVILDSSAIIKGNIKSKSVQINNGAAVEGMCSQCYADVNPTSFFEGLE